MKSKSVVKKETHTVDPLGDLKQPIRRLPIEEASKQRHFNGAVAVAPPIGSKTLLTLVHTNTTPSISISPKLNQFSQCSHLYITKKQTNGELNNYHNACYYNCVSLSNSL